MKLILWLLLLCGICPLTGQTQKNFSDYYYQRKELFEQLPNTENEIIFLGNSLTEACEWSELFQDSRMKNRGISGDITDGILYRLKEVTDSKPLKIFVMIGINDIAKNIPTTQILYNYEKIIKSIKNASPKTEVYVQSVLPVNNDFKGLRNYTSKTAQIMDLNKDLVALAQINNVKFVDLFSVFKDFSNKLDKKYTVDGVHLNARGYLLWKETLEPFIK